MRGVNGGAPEVWFGKLPKHVLQESCCSNSQALRLWEGRCEDSPRGLLRVGVRRVRLACPLGAAHTLENVGCLLPDNFHGARIIVLLIYPHDKYGRIG